MPLQPKLRQIKGVIRTANNQLAEGFSIELFLLAGEKEAQLGQDTTDKKGRYSLSYTLPKALKGAASSIFIRVYDPAGQLVGDSPTVDNPGTKVNLNFQLPEKGEVQPPAPTTAKVGLTNLTNIFDKNITVEGVVTTHNGNPAGGVSVVLFEIPFGENKIQRAEEATDGTGRYSLSFTTPNQALNTAVMVNVLKPDGTIWATSPKRFQLLGNLRIDLRLPDSDPATTGHEHGRLRAKLNDLTTNWEQLTVSQLNELARYIGVSAPRVRRIAVAEQLHQQRQLDSGMLYALLERGLPEDLERLVILPTERLNEALESAVAEGIIADGAWDTEIDKIKNLNVKQPEKLVSPENYYKTPDKVKASERPFVEKALNRYFREQVLEAIGGISPEFYELVETAVYELDYKGQLDQSFPDVLRQTLELAADEDQGLLKEASEFFKNRPQDNRKVRDVLQMDLSVQQHPALYEPLQRGAVFALADLAGITAKDIPTRLLERQLMADDWNEASLDPVVQQGILTSAQANELTQVSLLARLTTQNLALIQKLKPLANAGMGTLARFNTAEWEQLLVNENIPLPTGETAKTYAEKLNDRAGLLFPTAMVLDRFKRSLDQEAGGQDLRDWFSTFETNNPDFDLLRAKLSSKDTAGLTWTGIPADSRPQVQNQLAAMQRVLVLSSHPEQAQVLLQKGFNSAQKNSPPPEIGLY